MFYYYISCIGLAIFRVSSRNFWDLHKKREKRNEEKIVEEEEREENKCTHQEWSGLSSYRYTVRLRKSISSTSYIDFYFQSTAINMAVFSLLYYTQSLIFRCHEKYFAKNFQKIKKGANKTFDYTVFSIFCTL